MTRIVRLGLAALVALSPMLAACTSSSTPPAKTGEVSVLNAAPSAELWGEMKPVVSVKELMKNMIDPVSDNIFNAVSSTLTKNGLVDVMPRTDEDWDRIMTGAVSLAEGAYLLKVRRPFAPAGDLNNSTEPGAVELSPAQITAKVEKDPVEWNARIEALRNVALEVMDIVKRKDADQLWDAGENLDHACEACHRSYWYPGETPEFYKRLRDRLNEFNKTQRGGTTAPKR